MEKEALHVPAPKHKALNVLCNFFEAWKEPGAWTETGGPSGDPAQDALKINAHYDEIKNKLLTSYQRNLPICERIVTAIKQAEARHEEGEELLKPFLGKKRVKPEKVKEEEDSKPPIRHVVPENNSFSEEFSD